MATSSAPLLGVMESLTVLRELDENLWVGEARLRYLGVQMGRRMTVIRLTEGGLLVHSPMPLGEEFARRVR